MPAHDIYHRNIRQTLENTGWQVTADPYLLKVGVISMYSDLDYNLCTSIRSTHNTQTTVNG